MDREQVQKLLCESAGAKAALDQKEPQNPKIAITAENKMIQVEIKQAFLLTKGAGEDPAPQTFALYRRR